MTWHRAKAVRASAIAVIGFAMACASPAGNTADPLVGRYTAVTINGVPIPGAITNNQGVRLEVREGSFLFRADGTCSSRTVFVAPDGTEVVREVSATWTRDGDAVTMTWEGAGTTAGRVEGNTFTMDNVGMILVYRRDSPVAGSSAN